MAPLDKRGRLSICEGRAAMRYPTAFLLCTEAIPAAKLRQTPSTDKPSWCCHAQQGDHPALPMDGCRTDPAGILADCLVSGSLEKARFFLSRGNFLASFQRKAWAAGEGGSQTRVFSCSGHSSGRHFGPSRSRNHSRSHQRARKCLTSESRGCNGQFSTSSQTVQCLQTVRMVKTHVGSQSQTRALHRR